MNKKIIKKSPTLEELNKEGYNIKPKMYADELLLESPSSDIDVPFRIGKEYQNIDTITPYATYLPKEEHGKGLASRLYKAAEELTGRKIVADDNQTVGGDILHERKGLGNKFGISEEELTNRLTPTEKLMREDRKKALNSALEALSENPTVDTLWRQKHAIDINKNLEPRNIQSLLQNAYNKVEDLDLPEKSKAIKSAIPKILSRVKSVLPLGLGAAAALSAQDATAAVPILDSAENLGPLPQSDEFIMQDPTVSPQDRIEAQRRLSARIQALDALKK